MMWAFVVTALWVLVPVGVCAAVVWVVVGAAAAVRRERAAVRRDREGVRP